MRIVPYTHHFAQSAADLFNQAIAPVPHCYPVTASRFDQSVWRSDDPGRLERQAIALALRGDDLQGWIHVALERPAEQGQAHAGVIRFFYHRRGQWQAGHALLAWAEEYLHEHGARRIVAFHEHHRLPFYDLPYCGLSQHMDHVEMLLRASGYDPCDQHVLLDWPDFAPPVPGPVPGNVEIRIERTASRARLPGTRLSAEWEGQSIALFDACSAAAFADAPAAEPWALVLWLAVDPEHQNRGLGRYLLHRGLWELRQSGFLHASISASLHHPKTLCWYANTGFHAVDRTVTLARAL